MTTQKERFKSLLRKIGSGEHTSRGMSRDEASEALKIILQGQASSAQIGAFMMAHRIRRPEPQELAGMIDTYKELGPKLQSEKGHHHPICLGMPFDGRNRTAPIYPLTTLLLLSHGQPVVLQGGKRMPIKYGVTTVELFNALGLSLEGLTMEQLQDGFNKHGLALIHQPDHFPLADTLISYRDDIGKRPPLASMELIWTAHQGKHLLVSGFVHPPTEERAWEALKIMGEVDLITIKGLEGGTDLPISRACIIGRVHTDQSQRIILHPPEHDCSGKDEEWSSLNEWRNSALDALNNEGLFKSALRWNAGVYFWFTGIAKSISEGIAKAESSMSSGIANETLQTLIAWRENLKEVKIKQNYLQSDQET